MHAVDDLGRPGRIDVTIELGAKPTEHVITVLDSGVGLDPGRFDAFLTTDTDFKSNRGGKGIGRLLWLDAFESISVDSIYEHDGRLFRRAFNFVLAKNEQVQGETVEELEAGSAASGTGITLRGLRGTAYQGKFPSRPETIVRHFGSHFLAEFILGQSPPVHLTVADQTVEFPARSRIC